MTELLTAGSRVTITGILNIQSKGTTVVANLRGGGKDLGVNSCYVRAVGVEIDSQFSRVLPNITTSD